MKLKTFVFTLLMMDLGLCHGGTAYGGGSLADYLAMSPEKRYEFFAKLHERLNTGDTVSGIAKSIPGLEGNLGIARKVSETSWAQSTPFDELAKADILSDKVLDALGISHPMTGGVVQVPAGVMHTYGYLFAQLRTGFGLKGKRWIESRLDERLGLPAGSFSPFAPKGEFLSNVTYALSRLIPDWPRKSLAHVSPGIRAALRKPDPAAYEGRVVEAVEWKAEKGRVVSGIIRTHLLNFKVNLKALEGFASTDVVLLVYEAEIDGARRFVTAFPIDRKFADSILATKASTGSEFKPRFNLYVDPSWKVVRSRNLGFLNRLLSAREKERRSAKSPDGA